jgi:hypothetical protein
MISNQTQILASLIEFDLFATLTTFTSLTKIYLFAPNPLCLDSLSPFAYDY